MPDLPSLPLPASFNVVDALLLLALALYVSEDVRRGALFGLLDLAGFGVALLAALLAYVPVADWLAGQAGVPYALAKPLGFGLVWLGSDVLFALTLRRAARRPAQAVAGMRSGRLLGVLTGAARAMLAATLALAVITGLPTPEPVGRAVRESTVASHLADGAMAVQRALSGVFGEAVDQTLATLTVRPESNERVTLPFRVAEPRIDPAAEDRMLELVNQERSRAGLGALSVDPTIREVARAYSIDMFRRGFFSHVDLDGATPFDRMRRGGVRFSGAGENLALAPTVDVAHQGLMNSPGHRANILNGRFRRIGIGAASGGMHGRMFTQNFAD